MHASVYAREYCEREPVRACTRIVIEACVRVLILHLTDFVELSNKVG